MGRVPDTETFNLQNITTVIFGDVAAGRSLQECFDNARPWGFDPNYNNDSYAPANSMLRFRNYFHAELLFVGITRSFNHPCFIYDDGTVIEHNTTNLFASEPRLGDYSRLRKNLMARKQTDFNLLHSVDMTDPEGSSYTKTFSTDIKCVLFDEHANNWFVSSVSTRNAELIGDIFPSDINNSWTTFMSSIPTSGNIHYATHGDIGVGTGWYYSTENGEVARVDTLGGAGTEKMDSSTHEYYFISLLASYVAGIGKERDRNRYAWTGNDTVWTTFIVGNSGGVYQIAQYDDRYTLIIEQFSTGRRGIYYYDHFNPSATPQNIQTSDEYDDDVCVDGTDIYALTRFSDISTNSRIWKKSSIGGAWEFVLTTDIQLARIWKY